MTQKQGVIYTCITGGYDDLFNHAHMDPRWDYVCFTDGSIISGRENSLWEIRPLVFSNSDDVRNQRWHKLHPHILFPEYTKSVWIDANVNIVRKDLFDDVEKAISEARLMSIALHPVRNCIYDELLACIELRKNDEGVMQRQIASMKEDGFPSQQGLFETNIVYRKHHEKEVVQMMEDWWWWVKNYSRRDQLSLTYVLWKHGYTCLPLSDVSYRMSDGRVTFSEHSRHNDQELFNLKEILREKEEELAMMKTSKFWKLREKYLIFKGYFLKRN